MTLKELAMTGNLAHNAQRADTVPSYGKHVMQPKLDGWRILSEVCEDHVNFYSRSGKSYNGKLPHVEEVLLKHFPAGSWLDGEAVAIMYMADGKILSEWGNAQSVMSKGGVHHAAKSVSYVVFDLIAHRGIDARPLPYAKRRDLLTRIFDEDWPADAPVQLVAEYPASDGQHDKLVAQGYEGSIVRSRTTPYLSGKRGHGLFKRKAEDSEDVVVMGFESGTDVGAVVFGQLQDGKLVKRGTCKRKPNLIPTPDLMEWMGRVIEVKHNGVTKDGAFRHPRMERVRDDKPAHDCAWT